MITLTEKAVEHVLDTFKKEGRGPLEGLRLAVKGGGCSGLSYKVEFTEKREKDTVLTFGDLLVYIDPKSSIYLKDLVLDYKDGLNGKGLSFENPNAKNTCGCGESFSI